MQKAKVVLVKFWLRKAQRDLAVAQKLATDFPDIAIYHCQQGAEKALKGFLIMHDIDPGNTHNITTLIQRTRGSPHLQPANNPGGNLPDVLSQAPPKVRWGGTAGRQEERRQPIIYAVMQSLVLRRNNSTFDKENCPIRLQLWS